MASSACNLVKSTVSPAVVPRLVVGLPMVSLYVGLLLPIPTLPELSSVMLSVADVASLITVVLMVAVSIN